MFAISGRYRFTKASETAVGHVMTLWLQCPVVRQVVRGSASVSGQGIRGL